MTPTAEAAATTATAAATSGPRPPVPAPTPRGPASRALLGLLVAVGSATVANRDDESQADPDIACPGGDTFARAADLALSEPRGVLTDEGIQLTLFPSACCTTGQASTSAATGNGTRSFSPAARRSKRRLRVPCATVSQCRQICRRTGPALPRCCSR